MHRSILLSSISLLLFTGIISAQITNTIAINSTTRSYIITVPLNIINPALVINMHGLGSNASKQQLNTQFDKIAQRERFIVVYPDGLNNTWDATGDNDVSFISTLIDTISAQYAIDLNRVYATGMSMGGFMSHRLGCALSNRIAAIASVTGLNSSSNNCSLTRSVPVLQIHGTSDKVVFYSLVATTIKGWVNRNGCPLTPQITEPYPSTNPNSKVRKDYYGPGNNNSEVILLTVNGAEHEWVGSTDQNSDINASEEVWAFLKTHTLNQNGVSRKLISQNSGTITAQYAAGILRINSNKEIRSLKIIDLHGQMQLLSPLGKNHGSVEYLLPSVAAGMYTLIADQNGFKTALRFAFTRE
jgi:poly(3-hydroxybutyrate) depolymerase